MDKLEKLQSLFKLVNESISRQEFEESFKVLIDFVRQLKTTNQKERDEFDEKYKNIIQEIQIDCSSSIEQMKQKAESFCQAEMGEIKLDFKKLLTSFDDKVAEIKEACRPDEASIVSKASSIVQDALKPLIPTIQTFEADLPKLGQPIRDSLEFLQGDERLDKSAIKGLEELIEELRKEIKNKGNVMGGGINMSGFLLHFIDDETPTNSGDDLNFTIVHIPSPTSSLKVYRNGQRLRITEDYTFTGQTLTLLVALGATEILLVDYKI